MSSDNYAGRLSEYPNKGICGLPESLDSKRALAYKMAKLIEMVRSAKHVVVLSGAGISTNAGIPDFRGPNGIWTAEQEERKKTNTSKRRKRIEPADATDDVVTASRKRPKSCRSLGENYMTGGHNDVKSINGKDKRSNQLSFENASPTKTHKSITRLVEIGVIKFVITQNVDGLHRRSGLPRDKHAILHGCIFTEKCEKCHKEYFRDYDVGGISFQKTGRKCEVHTCNGHLRNTVLDWEDDLPDEDWELSQQHCHQSDLVIAIGTSLRIEPAGSLPTNAKKFVIVNKQVTPYDNKATLIIRSDVDEIFLQLMEAFDTKPTTE